MIEQTIFTAERVLLRPLTADDQPAALRYLNHPSLAGRRYLPWGFPGDLPLSQFQIKAIFKKTEEKKKGFTYAIALQEDGAVIGHASADWHWDALSPDVSLVIAPPLQQQGYGTEVLDLLLTYLFEETVANNVSGWMPDWNQPARSFAEKHGFQEAGQEQLVGIHKGKFYNDVVVDMLRAEWLASRVR